MRFEVAFDREEDGRWIAEITNLPGAMAYGETREIALAAVPQSRCVRLRNVNEELGPKMLSRIAKHTGLSPEDL
ncbi:hypothetical protein HNQ77_002566 [Silvibacterium bohemicum]|uniref:HicB family protein n=1 Tax=Silvibacterium bohemicum TaxID=1577686 RepID=A0A841JTX9_9BACT|nr:type II toxin-antitoxin system HicB family antitoxin [Silvibacterium bohemicum]MBB6144610.1 hypothetical protein [Silvibacterium bohemicum]